MEKPLIGITVSNAVGSSGTPAYQSSLTYSQAVVSGGGVPLLLPQEPGLVDRYAEVCDGVMLAGGDDVRMEPFGRATHPKACLMDARRQEFDLALLGACDRFPDKPVLGICLGVQLMALHNAGDLYQHLPDVLGDAAAELHRGYKRHHVNIERTDSALASASGALPHAVSGLGHEDLAPATRLHVGKVRGGSAGASPSPATLPPMGPVASAHHQAVSDPGRLRVVAHASDGVIEAVDDPRRAFYLGVQWHPERGGDDFLSLGLIARFVAACACRPRAT